MAATDAATANVASSTSSVQLAAGNTRRRADACGPSIVISNNSTSILYILLGGGSASSTNFSYAIQPTGGTAPQSQEIWGYWGAVQGAWAAANGGATVTEFL